MLSPGMLVVGAKRVCGANRQQGPKLVMTLTTTGRSSNVTKKHELIDTLTLMLNA